MKATTKGDWDCSNPACRRYYDVFRRPFEADRPGPTCPACRGRLRLIRILRAMPAEVRALLKARAQSRSEVA